MTDWHFTVLSAGDYDAVMALWIRAGLTVKPQGRDSREQFAAQLAGGTQTAVGAFVGERLAGVVLATHDAAKGGLTGWRCTRTTGGAGKAWRSSSRRNVCCTREGCE